MRALHKKAPVSKRYRDAFHLTNTAPSNPWIKARKYLGFVFAILWRRVRDLNYAYAVKCSKNPVNIVSTNGLKQRFVGVWVYLCTIRFYFLKGKLKGKKLDMFSLTQ